MKNVVYCGYRSWSTDLYSGLNNFCYKRGDVKLRPLVSSKESLVGLEGVDLVIFAGWSWIVPKEIIDKYLCVCIHPSNLPNFAGGSPIQHQVIAGEFDSKVTVFKMNNKLDSGPVYDKASVSLLGPIEEVYEKIRLACLPILRSLLTDLATGCIVFKKQSSEPIPLKRLKPKDGILTEKQVNDMTFKELENRINMLRSPYPGLSIKMGDSLVSCKEAIKYRYIPKGDYIKVKDGYARII